MRFLEHTTWALVFFQEYLEIAAAVILSIPKEVVSPSLTGFLGSRRERAEASLPGKWDHMSGGALSAQ